MSPFFRSCRLCHQGGHDLVKYGVRLKAGAVADVEPEALKEAA